MTKRGSLSAALQEVSGRSEPRPSPPPAPDAVAPVPGKSRIGKRNIAAYFDPIVSKQLKKLAVERDTNNQELLREALNDLFEKYGLSRIA